MTQLLPSRLPEEKKPLEKTYKVCELLASEGYEIMMKVDSNNASASCPELLVAVSQ